MKQLDLESFLGQFAPAMQVKLRQVAERDDIIALTASMVGDKLSASAFEAVPDNWPSTVASIYCKHRLHDDTDPMKSKTMQAVELVLNGTLTQYAAAAQLGISRAAVSRALSRREGKQVCPCCQQLIREGFKIDKTVLKPKDKK